MKLLLLFVAASVILVGAIVALALPNIVQAASGDKWCSGFPQTAPCFKSKAECKRSFPEGEVGVCIRNHS